ncbi:probable RNA-binding protein 19 isoform X1 [Ixodes scapularis]|uniref:probable RNA-binding protein 19 isoform X1 n=1 Tax=Ixodes scapularis TaxID=6945 RepID=UPI001C3845A7|nr:probable RNA-binding protein 19 isoform X1 [Ixodes scapularis]
MSRIIVKNLPKRVKEDRLREFFSSKGTITDLQLKYTKEGVFRRFAFVGYKDEAQAAVAKEYFHNAYLDTSKLQVDICKALGDAEKPRAWSKYSKDSSAYQKMHPEEKKPKPPKPEKPKKENFAEAFLKDLEGNEEFEEFLEVHSANKAAWGNDTRAPANATVAKSKKGGSDREKNNEQEAALKDDTGPHSRDKKTEGTSPEKASQGQPKESDIQRDTKSKLPVQEFNFSLKVSGLPYKCKKKQIKDFFKPVKVASLRVPPRIKGIAYLGFKTEKEMKQALNKHRSFMAGHKLEVTKYTKKVVPEQKWRKFESLGDPTETLADTGRIFVRNLSYTVTEDDIEALFKKFGPISEVHLSIDKITRKPKGFAFVSFMFPEHAIKAFSELDGKLLQGRLLHLIPAKAKNSEEEDAQKPMSFKDKKEAEQKKSSGSGHNWNTLFLGANALADVMAERYDTSKQELLGTEMGDSVAVRMALGETQVVTETKEFLQGQGVELDAFCRPATERSKTVILVKNLPAKTHPNEIQDAFAKFGTLSRVVLPPWGICALVEFQEPSEARTAFRRLAYSKFKHVPLYLEWAPIGVFKEKKTVPKPTLEDVTKEEPTKASEDGKKEAEKAERQEEEEEEEEPPEPDTTLFVKNLNFSTTEEALREHFAGCGPIHEVTIAKKKDLKNPGKMLSMGYGFVQFKLKQSAKKALKQLQHSKLDEHAVELKLSKRETAQQTAAELKRKKTDLGKESTKILVRNIPFEATKKELQELFSVFGTLRDIRLPKKMAGTGRHRGFAFVDFLTKNDAKRAFQALCQSTHLYGRRLVLEWASSDDQEVDTLRKKTADHFLQGGPTKKRLRKSDLMASLEGPAAGADPDL